MDSGQSLPPRAVLIAGMTAKGEPWTAKGHRAATGAAPTVRLDTRGVGTQFDYRDSLAPRGGLFQQPPDASRAAAHHRCGKDPARKKTALQDHGFRVRPKMTLASECTAAPGGRLRSPPPRPRGRAFPRICRQSVSGGMRENPRAESGCSHRRGEEENDTGDSGSTLAPRPGFSGGACARSRRRRPREGVLPQRERARGFRVQDARISPELRRTRAPAARKRRQRSHAPPYEGISEKFD